MGNQNFRTKMGHCEFGRRKGGDVTVTMALTDIVMSSIIGSSLFVHLSSVILIPN